MSQPWDRLVICLRCTLPLASMAAVIGSSPAAPLYMISGIDDGWMEIYWQNDIINLE